MDRYFSDDSFWNQPLPADAPVAEANDRYVRLLEASSKEPGPWLSLDKWTIPIFETGEDTPWVEMGKRLPEHIGEGRLLFGHSRMLVEDHPDHPMGHAKEFGPKIPMPAEAAPDAMTDGHLSILDRKTNQVWDMWGAERKADGSWWCCSGITYPLDGSGVFDVKEFDIHNGESIHLYGPCRASGTPNIAGILRYEEVMSGRIEHKLAFATRFCGLLEHCFPATWTDGGVLGGIPEGIVMRLNPDLDLDSFSLSEPVYAVARALQEYGAVCIDVCLGTTIGAENLNNKKDQSWDGVLDARDLNRFPFDELLFIEPEAKIEKGLSPLIHPIIFQTYHECMNLHCEVETEEYGTFVGWPKNWYESLLTKVTD